MARDFQSDRLADVLAPVAIIRPGRCGRSFERSLYPVALVQGDGRNSAAEPVCSVGLRPESVRAPDGLSDLLDCSATGDNRLARSCLSSLIATVTESRWSKPGGPVNANHSMALSSCVTRQLNSNCGVSSTCRRSCSILATVDAAALECRADLHDPIAPAAAIPVARTPRTDQSVSTDTVFGERSGGQLVGTRELAGRDALRPSCAIHPAISATPWP